MRDSDDPVHKITALLLAYLATHPDAADSVEGIRRWWLPSHIVAHPAQLEAALQELVAAGELAGRELPGGHALYARRGVGSGSVVTRQAVPARKVEP